MFPEWVDEHINQLSPDLALVTCCILHMLHYFSSYVCVLPPQPACKLLDSQDGSKEESWPPFLPAICSY